MLDAPHVTDPLCPDRGLPTVTRLEVIYAPRLGAYVEGRCPICHSQTVLNGDDGVGFCADHDYVNLPPAEAQFRGAA